MNMYSHITRFISWKVSTIKKFYRSEAQKSYRNRFTLSLLLLPFIIVFSNLVHAFSEGCSGKTTPGQADWKVYSSSGLYVDVDTSQCKDLGEDVIYFTSIEAGDNQTLTRGETSIYKSAENSFRIYIYSPGITPQLANASGWVINWMKYPNNETPSGANNVCSGHTSITNSNWIYNSSSGNYLDIDTSQCSFDSTPYYFTSLGGKSNHWTAKGITAIYKADKDSFRTYIKKSGISPDQARSKQWHMNWIAVDKSDNCAGETHYTDWKSWSTNRIYVDVDTSSCNLNYTPNYLTALAGTSYHWASQNSTFITNATPTGFRVYVYMSNLSVDLAETKKWEINWAVMRENTPPVARIYDNPWHMGSSNGLINNERIFHSPSTDADGDSLTYYWDLLGNGIELIGEYMPFTFTEAGNYLIEVTVRDGLESSSAQATIRVFAEEDVLVHCDYIIESQTPTGATARIELSNFGAFDIEEYVVSFEFLDRYYLNQLEIDGLNFTGQGSTGLPIFSLRGMPSAGDDPTAGTIPAGGPAGGKLIVPLSLDKESPSDGAHQKPLIYGDICTIQ